MKIYKIKCQLLSPIHIGTGETIEPFEYIIRKGKFYRIDLEDFVADLTETKHREFLDTLEENRLNDIRCFISDEIDLKRHARYSVDVSQEVERIYNEKLDDIHNQLIIAPFIRTAELNRAYLPGSSIKGAIRTAVINVIGKRKNFSYVKDDRKIEAEILNAKTGRGFLEAKRDPFRAIKIEDAILPEESTIISRVVNVGKDRFGNINVLSIQMFNEVTFCLLDGQLMECNSEMIIAEELFREDGVSIKIDLGLIRDACNSFYADKLRKDHNFYNNTDVQEASKKLSEQIFNEWSFLIRVGRYSGVESVTLDNYRNPRPPGGKGWGKTKNIVEMKYPLGWVKLTMEEKK